MGAVGKAVDAVNSLLQNPVAIVAAKIFAITAGLILISLMGYMLVTTNADSYNTFILNRNFVLWMVVLPLIAAALSAIYTPAGIPAEYQNAFRNGLRQLRWAALLLVAAFIYFLPDYNFSKIVKSEVRRAANLAYEYVLTPVRDRLKDAYFALLDKKVQLEDKKIAPAPEQKVYVYVESPKMEWLPHPGYYDDKAWYDWAALSLENREACRTSDWCQRAMRRLKEFGCLAPDNRLLERCSGQQ